MIRHLYLSLLFVIASCGGGGGGGSEPPAPIVFPTLDLSISPNEVYIGQLVTISWNTSSATSCTASGAWTGTKGLSGNESIRMDTEGSKTFNLNCTNSDGSTSRSVSVNVIGNSSGKVIGVNYISGANVFIDVNENYEFDGSEIEYISETDGSFTLPNDDVDLISKNGADSITGQLFENLSLSHDASISPPRILSAISSLDYFNETVPNTTTLLNIKDASIDVLTDDPISTIGESSSLNRYFELNSQLFLITYSTQMFVNETSSQVLNSSSFFQDLLSTLKFFYDSDIKYPSDDMLDLSEYIETKNFIETYVEAALNNNNLIPGAASDLFISTLTNMTKNISVRSDNVATEAIVNFASSTFLTDVLSIANNTFDQNRIDLYINNINSLIASDQNIDESLLTQTLTLVDDSIELDEDESIVFSPLTNDVVASSDNYYGLHISYSTPTNGSIRIDQNNDMTYVPNENFFGSDDFTYSVNLDGTSDSANINVEVLPINDPPTFIDFINAKAIDENILNVMNVEVSDVDNDDIGFSIKGVDQSKFSISTSGSLSFKSNPDFENPVDSNQDNIYELIIEASDGEEVVSKSLTITVIDVPNEGNPVIENLQSQSINENTQINVQFTVSDPQNDTLTYELTGIDSNLFTLTFDGSSASIASSAKDYETALDSDKNNIYVLSVSFSDELNTTSQEIEIEILNINDNTPTISSSRFISMAENQNSVATIEANDLDNDDLIFSLSGVDSQIFNISNNGILTTSENPNYEIKNSYSFDLNVSDGANSVSQNLVVQILDVNDPPVWTINTTSYSINENDSDVTIINIPVDVSDEDGDDITFTPWSGDEVYSFKFNDNLLLFRNPPDYEEPDDRDNDNNYSVIVRAYDGSTGVDAPQFSIEVLPVNDNAPEFINLQMSVEVTNGQVDVLNVSTIDADGDDVSFSLSGEDSSVFKIDDSGLLSFKVSPDFSNPSDANADNVYIVNVEASDGLFTADSGNLSITVLEVNNPPVINDLQTSYTLNENIIDIATFSVSDPEGNSLTVGVSGNDSSGFSIENNTLKYSGGFNFESPTDANTDNIYNLTIFADDGFNRTTQNVEITVVNVEEGPVFSIGPEVSISENERIVVNITVSDPEGDSFTWDTSIAGDDGSLFRYFGTNPDSKNLGFNSFEGADFEDPQDANSDNIYEVQLRAVEDKTNGIETTLNLSVSVTDIKDTWSISGSLYSNPYTLIDGDVPDIIDYPPVSNNDASSAQTILNPTDVIGHIGDNVETVVVLGDDGFCIEDPNNLGFCLTEDVQNIDPEDWFKFTAAPNLLLTLSVEGLIFEEDGSFYCCTTDNLDADLLIYNEDGSLASFSYTSNSTSTYKQIVLPSSGTFYAVVKAIEGHTKYVLTLGSNVTGVSTLQSPEDNYALGRFISYVPFGPDFNLTNDFVAQPDYIDEDLDTKFINFEKTQTKGLSIFNFDFDKEFASVFYEDYLSSSKNISQVTYLKHWKLLQHFKDKYPSIKLELDFKEKALFTKDPNWDYQWGLQQIGLESVLTAIGSNVKDVAVAVLDTGSPAETSTAYTTSAFAEGGYDFVPAENGGDGDGIDNDPTDSLAGVDSHGTHVATTISALNDGLNINGFGIQTVPIRVLGADGTGYVSDIIQGLLYAGGLPNISGLIYSGNVPVKVINMSLGSVRSSCSSSYQSAIDDIYSLGITLVAASGNDAQEYPGSYGYPASCNNVISVGALDTVKQRSYYSTYNDQVDIAAPGGDLTADINADGYRDGILAFGTNEDLEFLQGTSMASPHVAGAIAVLYALVPTLQPFQVDGLLADGHLTDDIGDEGKDDDFGFGALNLQKAVNRIIDDEGLDFTYGTIDVNSLNFGLDVTSYEFNINKIGDGELSVSDIESNIPSAIAISEVSVNSEGFGTYLITIDRNALPDGLYQANVSVSYSSENSSSFSVSFQVGADRERIYIPSVYIDLINDEGERVVGGSLEMEDGEVIFTAFDIPLDDYYFRFSTTIDRFILDPAEFYNYYPDASSPYDYFELGENDIENGAVTLIVNKSTGGLSTSEKILLRELKISVEDFNAAVSGQSSRIFKINE